MLGLEKQGVRARHQALVGNLAQLQAILVVVAERDEHKGSVSKEEERKHASLGSPGLKCTSCLDAAAPKLLDRQATSWSAFPHIEILIWSICLPEKFGAVAAIESARIQIREIGLTVH